MDITVLRTGYFSSLSLVITTLVTFTFAITAVPISGEFCIKDCIEYPYIETLSQYPKDYIWQYLAIVLLLNYLIFMATLHSFSSVSRKLFSRIGLLFSVISVTILLSCYFIQFTVIPASLINGESNGIALLTQYNPHGIFIALEELGYLMMSCSFLFIAQVFSGTQRIQRIIRWIFYCGFIITIFSFGLILFKLGIKRDYLFEIIVISIDWIVLVLNGLLINTIFKAALSKYIARPI